VINSDNLPSLASPVEICRETAIGNTQFSKEIILDQKKAFKDSIENLKVHPRNSI